MSEGEVFTVQYYEHSSRNWSPDPHINSLFIRTCLNFLQDRLKAQGYLFLNEIYDQLGLARTSQGQLVGWIYADCKPDEEIWASDSDSEEEFITLTFRTQGVMYDKIEAVKV